MTQEPAPALPTLNDDHSIMMDAVRKAGAAVKKRYEGATSVRSWAKDDSSPVSEADLEANDILHSMLMAGPRSEYGWLSEENADISTRLTAARTWIVDPIDGTRSFLEGRPEFTVCVALAEGDEIVASAIFNPITDELFEATLGGGARCNGEPIHASSCCGVSSCRMLGWPAMFQHPGWPRPWPDMTVGYRNSTSFRMALVAKGTFDAALALVPKADWDVAMGALICSEAGAMVSDHKGAPFRFNQPTPRQRALVCAAPELYPALIERLDHLPDELTPLTATSRSDATV